jgi:hypothetical protein
MFSASIASGDVLAVDVLTGESHLAVDAPPGRTAAGLEQDCWGRLWVAGGPTGRRTSTGWTEPRGPPCRSAPRRPPSSTTW